MLAFIVQKWSVSGDHRLLGAGDVSPLILHGLQMWPDFRGLTSPAPNAVLKQVYRFCTSTFVPFLFDSTMSGSLSPLMSPTKN